MKKIVALCAVSAAILAGCGSFNAKTVPSNIKVDNVCVLQRANSPLIAQYISENLTQRGISNHIVKTQGTCKNIIWYNARMNGDYQYITKSTTSIKINDKRVGTVKYKNRDKVTSLKDQVNNIMTNLLGRR
ncbi:hypothetical protein [Basilea psittacipulmonis]|uniref:Lipoprotein n=1 Tax=Basilea psittacipulmonis DSM 24701 TaxID=1072685 RepID=A0A077DIH8_9BURK|nr:hypothetical protein [Basilea psittacipulmonis]AIL33272.1 hypothetical protein IX83_08150 [Basilea psittacipulmonis DSM 24701]